MSNALALATVTATIRALLKRRLGGLMDSGLFDNLSAPPDVTTLPPDLVQADASIKAGLNLFLLGVTPNAGWSNQTLPGRNRDGFLTAPPLLALDLQYLLTATGNEKLQAEALLGVAMQQLHETPGLSRKFIRDTLDEASGDATLPASFRGRTASLADQIESLRITPSFLSRDEMSKIWTSLQAHYRTSVVYQVSAVLIESELPTRSAPPVLYRGDGDRGPTVFAGLIPPVPTLTAIGLPDNHPVARLADTVTVRGHHLAGTNPVVTFTHPRLPIRLQVAPDPDAVTDSSFSVLLASAVLSDPSDPKAKSWAAGVYQLQYSVTRPGESKPRRSNTLPFILAPSFAEPAPADVQVIEAAGKRVRLQVTLSVSPDFQDRQTASLQVGSEELVLKPAAPAGAKLTFLGPLPPPMLEAGQEHLLRLRVDDLESLCFKLDPLSPADRPHYLYDPQQMVTIP